MSFYVSKKAFQNYLNFLNTKFLTNKVIYWVTILPNSNSSQNLKGPQSNDGGMETMVYIAGRVERKRMTNSMAM